jgi:2,4'-dihydroxyacetophenone dioxygenase
MITLFCIHGPIEYIGPDGQVRFTETAETKTAKYADYCRQNNIAWHLLSIDYQA